MAVIGKLELLRSPFLPISGNAPSFVAPENIKKVKVFLYFQGVKNGNIGQKCIKLAEDASISEKFASVPLRQIDKLFIITNRKKIFEFVHKQLEIPTRLKEPYSHSRALLHQNFGI